MFSGSFVSLHPLFPYTPPPSAILGLSYTALLCPIFPLLFWYCIAYSPVQTSTTVGLHLPSLFPLPLRPLLDHQDLIGPWSPALCARFFRLFPHPFTPLSPPSTSPASQSTPVFSPFLVPYFRLHLLKPLPYPSVIDLHPGPWQSWVDFRLKSLVSCPPVLNSPSSPALVTPRLLMSSCDL